MEYGKPHTISVGPWGGQDGIHWDDGVYSGIRQIVISHGAGIDAIQFEYDRNGTSVWSDKHGGNGGTHVDKVMLDYPDEFLTSIHGYYGSLQEWGLVIVRSLAFESNKRTLGRYGIELGTYFSFPMTQGKIVGFHGKSGWYLDSIGVYLEPLMSKHIIPSNSLVHSQQSFFQAGKYEYSMLQGNSYDLILAIRHKEKYNNGNYTLDSLSRQSSASREFSRIDNQQLVKYNGNQESLSRQTFDSQEFSRTPSQSKIVNASPAKIEKVPSRNAPGVVTYGPWGGNGGSLFDDGVYDGVKEIQLSRNVGIVSIRVCYDLNGQPVWGEKNGGTGGFKSDKILFNYPSEILTHITGHYGPAMGMGPNVIKSLTFHTTKGKYGPYGDEQGQSFSTKLKEGAVVGFHGRKGLFVDAVGVHVLEGKVMPVPVSSSPSNSIILKGQPKTEVDSSPSWSFKLGKYGLMGETAEKIVKNPAPFGPGPWGGEGGKPWDDGVFTGIKQIILSRTEAICCMEIEYDRNGQSVWSVKHGSSSGLASLNRIKLEYPNEVLIRICGYYGPLSNDHGIKVIKSLTLYTSRRKYGPFGEELGQYFSSTTTEGKVVGFHGRSGIYLDAIGVHMQHWLGGNQRTSKMSLRNIFY